MSTDITLLIDDQDKLRGWMSRAYLNFTKLGAAKMTKANCRLHLTQLEAKWQKYQVAHDKLMALCIGDQRQMHQDLLEETESIYLGEATQFQSRLDGDREGSSPPGLTSNPDGQRTTVRHQLPRIAIARFNGDYRDWPRFRDLFQAIVINNDSVTDVERLHHLKTSVDNEPAQLLANIPIAEDNFTRAWDMLKLNYEDKRALIETQLEALLDLEPVESENVADLDQLVTGTRQAVRALQTLGRPVGTDGDVLVFITVRKLDPQTRRDWETSVADASEIPNLDELFEFLHKKLKILRNLGKSQPKPATTTTTTRPPAKLKTHAATGKPRVTQGKQRPTPSLYPSCPCCNQGHHMGSCESFKAKTIPRRREFVISNSLCFNCLGSHAVRDCRSNRGCRTCNMRHHTLLHELQASKGDDQKGGLAIGRTAASTSSATSPPVNILTSQSKPTSPTPVLLGTALVKVQSTEGRTSLVRALIDPGAESSFISEALTQQLHMKRRPDHLLISGIGAASPGVSRGRVHFTLAPHSPDTPLQIQVSALVLPCLTDYVPPRRAKQIRWPQLRKLPLADPSFSASTPVDLIIGVDVFTLLLRPGLETGPHGLVAQQTTFGWILFGTISEPQSRIVGTHDETQGSRPIIGLTCAAHDNLPLLVQRFWEQEEAQPPPRALLTEEERDCEDHFASTHTRDASGRYVVRLPFNKLTSKLGESKPQARRTLLSMERRFRRNPDLELQYRKFLEEYLQLGHMEKSLHEPTEGKHFYLPHHGVLKEGSLSTKLRVVFNGSQRSSTGVSLNEQLHVGPKLQTELCDVLLRWRMPKFVFATDIEKMFRQIVVHPDDRDFQRILWQPDHSDGPTEYRLSTVTYGLACAPYLALRTIQQLATDYVDQYPLAARTLRDNIYVDDILAGADELDSALTLQQELLKLLSAGGFPLKKWVANDCRLLEKIPTDWIAPSAARSWEAESDYHMLGLRWQVETDAFVFRTTLPPLTTMASKRSVLSDIAKLFDPLGWLAPVTIRCKVFMQSLWLLGIGWDDPLPAATLDHWTQLYENLRDVHAMRIPRWSGASKSSRFLEIHGFADASNTSYAAVLYLRVCLPEGEIRTTLLSAKTKVAPLKQVSIPRLELCGAQLLTRLATHVIKTLNLTDVPMHLWSDSTTTLAWIQSPPARWKTYVANRVSNIQTTAPNAYWHHVAGTDNPADCATRGLSAAQLGDFPLWWTGPAWLSRHSEPWRAEDKFPQPGDAPEQRTITLAAKVTTSELWDIFAPVASSLGKLLRVTARCRRWLRLLPSRQQGIATDLPAHILSPAEISQARTAWIRAVQDTAFRAEITALSTNSERLPKGSQLAPLKPMRDGQGCLRVGGRLRHSLLDPDECHPFILPRFSQFTDLLIDSCHKRTLHGGTQLTLTTLRQTYWILRGRQAVKMRISRCIACMRHRASFAIQQMGNLPASRVRPTRAFFHSGVDYCGPVDIRTTPGRGHKSQKGYIVVFVCLSTRAVHLEAVSGYSTDHFLAAFRRFTSRRGIPATLSSDQGTNFVGANNELCKLFSAASASTTEIAASLATDGTTWRFNPPGAPHHGGIWEAAVKSIKHHLKRVIGETKLTFEELTTLLTQIEACLNSRPLHPATDDPADLSVLTPGHFLVGGPMNSVPEPSLMELQLNRLNRWQLIQRMREAYWRRWSAEYLHHLQALPKWRQARPAPRVGDLAILKSETQPPAKWSLCRITDLHPGDDGLVRVVTVKTATSTFKRPITKLCFLPVEPEPSRTLTTDSE